MRKMSKVIIALITVLALGLAVAGCSCTTSTTKDSNNTTTTTNTATDRSTSSDKKSNSVIGSWRYTDKDVPELTATYTFNEDGTGQYDIAGQIMKLTYKVDGDKLSITFEGQSIPMDVEYKVSDDTLKIKDITDEYIEYKKV